MYNGLYTDIILRTYNYLLFIIFYPGDAMLARYYYLSSGVCVSQVGVLLEHIDGLSWFRDTEVSFDLFYRPVMCCNEIQVSIKIRVISSETCPKMWHGRLMFKSVEQFHLMQTFTAKHALQTYPTVSLSVCLSVCHIHAFSII